MAQTRILVVDAQTGKQEYKEAEVDLSPASSEIGGRDITKELDDLIALLKSKGVI